MSKFKNLLILLMIFSIAIPAHAKKTKTAESKDGVLTDLKLNYTLSVPDNWRVKTFKEEPEKPAILRAMLTQRNYQVNMQARDLDGDYTIPEIQIFARPAKMTAEEFYDSLKAAVFSHSSDDDIINQLNLLLSGEYVDSMHVKLAGENAILTRYKRVWERHLQADASDPRYRQYGGRIVQDVHDVNEILILVHEGYLYVIQAVCENEFYLQLHDEFAKIIGSLKFADAGATSTE